MTLKELLERLPQAQEVVIYRQGGEYPDFEGYAYDATQAMDARGLLNLAVVEIETHRYDHVIYVRCFSILSRVKND